jgi:hypothetical protein
MFKKAILVIFCALFAYSLCYADPQDPSKLLTVQDVEKVTDRTGVKLVPKNPMKGAGGDLNFALADETILVIAAIQKAEMYETWKKQEGFFHAEVPGIGDAAFEGPSIGEARYLLIFKKGKTAVSLSSFFNMKAGGDPFLSQNQLRALAKIVTLRLDSGH